MIKFNIHLKKYYIKYFKNEFYLISIFSLISIEKNIFFNK